MDRFPTHDHRCAGTRVRASADRVEERRSRVKSGCDGVLEPPVQAVQESSRAPFGVPLPGRIEVDAQLVAGQDMWISLEAQVLDVNKRRGQEAAVNHYHDILAGLHHETARFKRHAGRVDSEAARCIARDSRPPGQARERVCCGGNCFAELSQEGGLPVAGFLA